MVTLKDTDKAVMRKAEANKLTDAVRSLLNAQVRFTTGPSQVLAANDGGVVINISIQEIESLLIQRGNLG